MKPIGLDPKQSGENLRLDHFFGGMMRLEEVEIFVERSEAVSIDIIVVEVHAVPFELRRSEFLGAQSVVAVGVGHIKDVLRDPDRS